MENAARPRVAVLAAIPPDVRAALQFEHELLAPEEWSLLSAEDRADIRLALTSAVGGAAREVVESLPGLRRIASVGAGLEGFDQAWLGARNIQLCATPEVMTEDTAECAVALTFAALRNVVSNDRFVRSGEWAQGRAPLGLRISAARVGIVGLGRIGSRIAEKLTALGSNVAYSGRTKRDVPWRFEPDLVSLAATVDVLILSCAGGAATRKLVNASVLDALGPQGFLINVSRGSVVDEDALIAALAQGRIAGAALDVFESEPTPDRRFLALENCILQPHAAVYTRQNRADLIARIRELLSA